MRIPFLLASALALAVVSGAAQTKFDVKDIENHPFTADFNSGGKLRMLPCVLWAVSPRGACKILPPMSLVFI